MLTARDEFDLYEHVTSIGLGGAAKAAVDTGDRDAQRDRDRRIIRVARRWHRNPLQPPGHGRFVAGDVAAIRTAISEQTIEARHQQRLEAIEGGAKPALDSSFAHGVVLDLAAEHWMLTARPYFVGTQTLTGLVDCEIPSPTELDELRLPAEHVAVYFGGDLTVPIELLEHDNTLAEMGERQSNATPDATGHVDGDSAPPYVIPGPIISVARRQPVQICGVLLQADADGRLSNVVIWLVTCPEHGTPNRHAIYGYLDRSLLRYVAINVAAAIAWGQWTSPAPADLPAADDPRFRDVIRSSKFRKREPEGAALGVHILDVKRTIGTRPKRDGASTHGFPGVPLTNMSWSAKLHLATL